MKKETSYDEAAQRILDSKHEMDEALEGLFVTRSKRIAKDGEPFDVDNLVRETGLDEVEIIQFLRPNAKRRRMVAVVGTDVAVKAEHLILTVEDLGTGQISIWARRVGEPVEKDRIKLADNSPGEREPTKVLIELIEEMWDVEDN
jgi:hypothetical protein